MEGTAMEETMSESEEQQQQRLISSFIDIAVGQTHETARWFLQAKSWKLDEALMLFYSETQNPYDLQNDYEERETLHEQSSSTWGENQDTSSVLGDRLSSLYSPPFHLLFDGTFEEAKSEASRQGKWLLLNLQSTKEFSSHTLNRDIWSNDAVSQTIEANFVFLQVYDDTREGLRVCWLYDLGSAPAVLVIDPITGQKMSSWCGMIDSETLLEDLERFIDNSPRELFASYSLSRKRQRGNSDATREGEVDDMNEEDEKLQEEVAASLKNMAISTLSDEYTDQACSSNAIPAFPPLPEEPKGDSDCDRSVLCRVCVRLPDGQRLQRNFMKTDPIQLLWSLCYSQLEDSERKPFKLVLAIPGASKTLEYESNLTFEQSGLITR